MGRILNIDTATTVCSVALAEDNTILAIRENREGKNHAFLLAPFIDEVLKEAGMKPADLSAIAISKGPGSYTGLRIGVSTAKGMAYALSIPLISLSTLSLMANGYLIAHPEISDRNDILLCPMIDARRMEVYSAIFNTHLEEFRRVKAEVIERNSFNDIPGKYKLIFFGDGAEKCLGKINRQSILTDTTYFISASQMVSLTSKKFNNSEFENVAYFEPFYLKDFVATTPKNKMF
jgi:tRNA threonylcarbamoyladenosine biosynthesis protein TsaB